MQGFYGKRSSEEVCVLYSGGKDSTYALHWAVLKMFNVSCLVSIKPRSQESMMFHVPYVELTRLQAQALEIPLVYYEQGYESDEEALRKALEIALREYGCSGVVTGALRSDYQRMRVAESAHMYGLNLYNPLWWRSQERYMFRLVDMGFHFIITSITVKGLDPQLLGKELSREDITSIINSSKIHGFNPAFEGGEAETLVLDAPLFKKRLRVRGEALRTGEYSWYFRISDARLEEKSHEEGISDVTKMGNSIYE
ncbi:MAG: diphthine--ammonia ligase [Infirmifilum sp.]